MIRVIVKTVIVWKREKTGRTRSNRGEKLFRSALRLTIYNKTEMDLYEKFYRICDR